VLLASFTPLSIALVILFIYGLNTSTGMVRFNSTIQGAIPDAMRERVFTLLDIDWNAMRLLSLALGGLIVDRLGIEVLFWSGRTPLLCAGRLGLLLLGEVQPQTGDHSYHCRLTAKESSQPVPTPHPPFP
jgi:hypothetical protein